jgi:hypothetical protein
MRQRAMIAMALASCAADPHRRRADHRARRDHPGADHLADRRPALRAGLGHSHHPRPRRGGGDRRSRARDVRRDGRRAGHADELFYDPQHPTPGGCSARSRGWDRSARTALPRSRGRPRRSSRPPRGLPVPPTMPARVRPSARSCPRSRRAPAAAHVDRCWLSPEEKRQARGQDASASSPGMRPRGSSARSVASETVLA